MKTLVSCIIPTFNRPQMLKEAIDSIRAQTHPHWELLVVDDHSTDNTAEVIKRYQKADPRIRYLKNPKKGVTSARNHGVKAANSHIIAFLDHDDISWPHRFESQLRAMETSGTQFLVSGMQVIDTKGGKAPENFKLELKATAAGFPSRWMLNKGLLEKAGGFDEEFSCMEDVECSYRLARHETFAMHDDIVLTYRIVPGSISRNIRGNLEARLRIIEKHGAFLPTLETAWWHYSAGMDYYALREEEEALAQLEKAAQLDDRGIYRWAYLLLKKTPFRKGIFKKINLRVLKELGSYKFPPLVEHQVIPRQVEPIPVNAIQLASN